MNEKEVKALPVKELRPAEFQTLCRRLKVPMGMKKIMALDNMQFLGIYSPDEGRTFVRLHLRKFWIKPYTLSYRTTKTKNGKARVGREIIISSVPLPRRLNIRGK